MEEIVVSFRAAAPGLLSLLIACSGSPGNQVDRQSIPGDGAATGTEALNRIVEDYFDETLELNPVFATFIGDDRFNDRFPNNLGPEHRDRTLALERRYLDALERIDRGELSEKDLLTLEIFRRGRELNIEGHRFPSHLVPVNQFYSTPNSFAQMGSGSGIHPFRDLGDYEDFLKRIEGFRIWVDQAIENMREGVEAGIVQPRILMEKTVPQLTAQVTEDPEKSLFFRPVENFPDSIGAGDRRRLEDAYTVAIRETIVPAYRKLRDFIRDDYLPRTRDEVGIQSLPGGADWYAYLVRRITTTDLSPREIHEIGLREVERIHQEMARVQAEVGFEGDQDSFFEFLNSDDRFYFEEREQLLDGYRGLRQNVHSLARNLFEIFPRADYEIRAVEPFRERSASGASYRGATPDGSRPGVFFVNTYDLKARPNWAMESLFLHEAVPGHHFQRSIQREIDGLPRFRRFGSFTAYVEGWGLYAESLGKELGVYQDPYQHFGALAAELWRAIRLVVDTGLHDQGWTRQQVLEFMYGNAAVKEARAVSEAERYIAIPGQALAYKIGQLKISELRSRAEERLRSRFNVKAFHSLILQDGALPLDVLEAKVNRWILRQARLADKEGISY